MTEAERREAYLQCEKFLNGQKPLRLKAQFQDLVDETSEDEVADVYGSGKIIEDFEREVAELLGKESAVFMPSGTMAQLIALRIWCDRAKSKKIALHPTSHLELHEQKAYRELHGLESETLGTEDTPLSSRDFQTSSGEYAAALIEIPQRESGGILPKWDEVEAMTEYCRSRSIKVHMDGARLWESAYFFQKSYAEICAVFDSVYVSFYKGLGGLTGAILAGPKDFIAEAKIWQRRHGGNLYRLAPYVISARENLRLRLPKMTAYNLKAREIAEVLNSIDGIKTVPAVPDTNMMHVYFDRDVESLQDAFAGIAQDEKVGLFFRLQPVEPAGSKTELSIGDAAFELDISQVRILFQKALKQSR